MDFTLIWTIFNLVLLTIITCFIFYVFHLIIRALRKYLFGISSRDEKTNRKKSLSEVLISYRKQNKMTQEYVAEALGVSRQSVSKWERGESDPSTANLLAIAKLYNTSFDDILRDLK